jgi:Holliday junction resolvase-like predicted endonuclease
VKDRVYVPPLPATVDELQERIIATVNSVTPDMLQREWSQLDYRIDVCRVTKEGNIECV